MLDADRVRILLKARCKRAGGWEKWAEKHGLPPTSVRNWYFGLRDPGEKLLEIMGLEKVVGYQYKGKMKPRKHGEFGTIYGEADE
jgi:hypothetical protein